MPPDPQSSAALSRRLSSRRPVSFLDCPKPFVELARLDRLHVCLDKPRQLSRFARRDLASGNCRCDRSHCAGCITSGPKRGQLKAHQPFSPRWPARFEQSQEQMIRVSADRDRLTVIVANEIACTHERFGDAFNGAPTRLRFEPIGGDILCFLPGAGELWVCLPEFVDTSSATAGDRDCSCHAASVGEGLQKAPLAHFGELQPIHSPPPNAATPNFGSRFGRRIVFFVPPDLNATISELSAMRLFRETPCAAAPSLPTRHARLLALFCGFSMASIRSP